MNPFYWLLGLGTAAALARKCPKCGEVQVVPKRRRNETVPCRRCGTGIPPTRRSV